MEEDTHGLPFGFESLMVFGSIYLWGCIISLPIYF